MSLMCVADKYQLIEPLSINGGTWKKDGQKKLICRKIFKRSFIDDQNNQQSSRFVYIVDESATLEMMDKREESVKENAIKKQKENVTMADLVGAIAGNASSEKKEVKAPKSEKKSHESNENKTSVKSELPDDTWSEDELKQYCIENNIEFHPRAGKKKFLELINNK